MTDNNTEDQVAEWLLAQVRAADARPSDDFLARLAAIAPGATAALAICPAEADDMPPWAP